MAKSKSLVTQMYCIEHGHMVSMVTPMETALMPVSYHLLGYHEVDVCTGPFATCPPPAVPFLFDEGDVPDEELLQTTN